MTTITIDGTDFDVQLNNSVLSGYSGGLQEFSDVNRLPQFDVSATVNGQQIDVPVSFAGHHLIPPTLGRDIPAVQNLLDDVGFDVNDFATNGVALPNFAPAGSATVKSVP